MCLAVNFFGKKVSCAPCWQAVGLCLAAIFFMIKALLKVDFLLSLRAAGREGRTNNHQLTLC